MAPARPEITGVPGVPETAVSQALLASLPAGSAPAPWTVTCKAVLWVARARPAALTALPAALRPGARPLVVVGAMVRYLDTPVGPYDEVLGLVGVRTGTTVRGSVCFMAVDSPASLVGGRANWGMPKALGAFAGAVGHGLSMVARGADETVWSVTATPRVVGPRLPAGVRAVTRQEFDGGRIGDSRLRAHGRVRLARVDVEVDSAGSLSAWLRPGRHVGAVVDATFTLGPPTMLG